MARSLFLLNEELKKTFSSAQESVNVRFFIIGIVNENELVLISQAPGTSNTEDDFNNLRNYVSHNEPSLILFKESVEGSNKWLLVSWVPESSKVRLKMLYSSSKVDLKEGLGLGYFRSEYYASELSELTYEALAMSRDTTHDADLLSEREVIKKELDEMARHITTKSNAMGTIPFEPSQEVTEQIEEFKKGNVNLLEMAIQSEGTIGLTKSDLVDFKMKLSGCVNELEPRFILIRHYSNEVFFIYSCPEEANIRLKMTYSTARASVISVLSNAGIDCSKSFECGGPKEIDETLEYELKGVPVGSNTGALNNAVNLNSKPSRPGRGRSRLTKPQFP